jgi:hypothetical protein
VYALTLRELWTKAAAAVCSPFFFCSSYTRINRPSLYSWHDPISCAICYAVCMSRDLREWSVTITCLLCYISINMHHPIVRPPHVPGWHARHPHYPIWPLMSRQMRIYAANNGKIRKHNVQPTSPYPSPHVTIYASVSFKFRMHKRLVHARGSPTTCHVVPRPHT